MSRVYGRSDRAKYSDEHIGSHYLRTGAPGSGGSQPNAGRGSAADDEGDASASPARERVYPMPVRHLQYKRERDSSLDDTYHHDDTGVDFELTPHESDAPTARSRHVSHRPRRTSWSINTSRPAAGFWFVSPPDSPSASDDSDHVVAALLFWRRHVIRTHFAAWKNAIHRRAARRSQPKRLSPRRHRPIAWSTPRENILLRNARVQASRSPPSTKPRAFSSVTHRELETDLSGERLTQRRHQHNLDRENSSTKRHELRASLQLAYFSFSRWKTATEACRHLSLLLERRAQQWHQERYERQVIQAWKQRALARQHRLRQFETAIAMCDHGCKRSRFARWSRYCKVAHELRRRQVIIGARQLHKLFGRWKAFAMREQRLSVWIDENQIRRTRTALRHFRDSVARLKLDQSNKSRADAHYNHRLQASIFGAWRSHVLESDSFLNMVRCTKQVKLMTGLLRWFIFVRRRHEYAQQLLQADYLCYRSCIRNGLRYWRQYHEIVQRDARMHETAADYHQHSVLRSCFQVWVVFLQRRARKNRRVMQVDAWRRHGVLLSCFRCWHRMLRHNALSNQFLATVQERRLQRMVRLWKAWVTRTRSVRAKYDCVREHCTKIRLRRLLSAWKQSWAITVALHSRHTDRRQRLLKNYLLAWTTAARRQKFRRSAENAIQTKVRSLLLKTFVRQWHDAALHRRCCRQLVKLFRKKTARSIYRVVFRCLRVFAAGCKNRRRRAGELIHRCFLRWRSSSATAKAVRASNSLAAEYYFKRQGTMAVRNWEATIKCLKSDRVKTLKALEHYYNAIVRQVLHGWYLWARRRRRKAHFLQDCSLQRQYRILESTFRWWYEVGQTRRRRELQHLVSSRHVRTRMRRFAWKAWRLFVWIRRGKRQQTAAAVDMHARNCSRRLIREWRKVAARLKQLRRRAVHFRCTKMRQRLSTCIVVWKQNHRHRVRSVRQHAQADSFYYETLLCRSLLSWQALWLEKTARRDKVEAAEANLLHRRLHLTVQRWRQRCRFCSANRRVVQRASDYHSLVLITKGTRYWKIFREMSRVNRIRLLTAVCYRQKQLKAKGFVMLKCYADQYRALKMHLDEIFHRDTRVLMILVFQHWRRYRRTSSLNRAAACLRSRHLCGTVWRHWREHCAFVATMKRKSIVRVELFRANLLRAAFIAWKTIHSCRQEHLMRMSNAESHLVRHQCRSAIKQWVEYCGRRNWSTAVRQLGRERTLCSVLKRWQAFICQCSQKRDQIIHADQFRYRNVLLTNFCRWSRIVRRTTRNTREKADAQYDAVLSRKVWSAWRRLLHWSVVSSAINTRRNAVMMRDTWTHWQLYMSRRRQAKQSKLRVLLFLRSRRKARAWKAWYQYVCCRHERYQQYQSADEHYSVSVLLRRHFAAWVKKNTFQQRQADLLALATVHYIQICLRTVLQHWTAYVIHRHQLCEQLDNNQDRICRFLLARGVAKWKMLTTTKRKIQRGYQEAERYYRGRRLMAGLVGLSQWKCRQQRARLHALQASRFWQRKRIEVSFGTWRRYHAWRRRNRNLVRLFHESHKGDFFIRWKAFCELQRDKAVLALKARMVCCKHLEQRRVRQWVAFVAHQRRRKQALLFNICRVLRSSYRRWMRRIRVIKQMRRLARNHDSFRLESHFSAWQRIYYRRKEEAKRFQRATHFINCSWTKAAWTKWMVWMKQVRVERMVICRAEGFRHRLAMRKSFAVWMQRVYYWKRKRVLGAAAAATRRIQRLDCILAAWRSWWRARRELRARQSQFSTRLSATRLRYAVCCLRMECSNRQLTDKARMRALAHWKRHLLAWTWRLLRLWRSQAMRTRAKMKRADTFARAVFLSRSFRSIQIFVERSSAMRKSLRAFRHRYFETIVERCFARWRSASILCQQLRSIVRRSTRRRRFELLVRWRRYVIDCSARRRQWAAAVAHHRASQLARWFLHWESASTDRWIEHQLLALHSRARNQHLAAKGVAQWTLALHARRKRRHWRAPFLRTRRAWLVEVLRVWRESINN